MNSYPKTHNKGERLLHSLYPIFNKGGVGKTTLYWKRGKKGGKYFPFSLLAGGE